MPFFRRFVDLFSLGSDTPILRLVAYYIGLGVVIFALAYFFPESERLILGRGAAAPVTTPIVLQDGMNATPETATSLGTGSLLELAVTTTLVLLGTIVLMLPVSWVYMSARHVPGHSQAVVQTLIILPLVVAGIVLIVRDSLALAFSLAGVVAAVRFRTNLRDTRDVVFIFLAIAVGFASGVQTLAVGAVLTIAFNFVLLLTWRYDYGRNVLTPTAASQWAGPLSSLANTGEHDAVPDRDLMLSLSPQTADKLAERFERVSDVLGKRKKKPRFTSVLTVTTNEVAEAQERIEKVLEETAKRWKLDEVVTNTGRPSEIYYILRPRKSVSRDELLTAIRDVAGDKIEHADLESREISDDEVSISA
ncbi:MAG TPA: DUF4956 domain-containing protein [Gemmatimonadaceae bacterium]|nr:DUF4956 domain-containing protein [Gemmatimonadaceae bacterium]